MARRWRSCCWRGRRRRREFRGSDLLGNVAPESQVGGGLADKYPLSAYALDYHVDVGVTDPDGRAADDRPVGRGAAVERDQLPGQVHDRPVHVGVLARPAQRRRRARWRRSRDAITSLYENVIGEAWMVVAILIAGIWGIWKALVQRRYTETAGALGRLGAVRADRAVLRLPARAHGRAGEPLDEHALARVPLGRQPRLARRSRAGQAPGRRPPVRDARLPAVGGARVRRAAPLRRHRPPRRRRLPAPGRPARPGARRLPRPPQAGQRRARRLRAAVPAPAARLGGAQGRVRRAAQGRARRSTTGSSPATASTRPTRPRSTSSRPAAPSSG